MELRGYLELFDRQKRIIAAVIVLTLLIAVTLSLLVPPVYTATAQLRLATAKGGSISYIDFDVEYADRLMNTYAELAATAALQDSLQAQLGMSERPDVVVESVPNTELMRIAARHQLPQIAADVANGTAGLLISASDQADISGDRTLSNLLSVQLAQIEQRLLTLRNSLAELTTNDPQRRSLENEITLHEATYRDLLREFELGQVREQLHTSRLSLVDAAKAPVQPSWPNWPLNIALGALLGVLGGIALAFVYDAVDTSLSTPQQIARMVQSLDGRTAPTLAEIPAIHGNIDHTMVGIPQVEAFRRLYTNIYGKGGAASGEQSKLPKTLLITSAEKGEGKTTILVNLALALANAGKRVLVVDANLRAPMAATTLGAVNKQGFSDLVMDEGNLRTTIQKGLVPRVYVMAAGTFQSARFLYLSQTRHVLKMLTEKFDVVLIDTPAALHYSDALALMPHVDAVLLVVDQQRSRRETIIAVQQQLSNLQIEPLGIVINETTPVTSRSRLRQELLAY